MRRRDTQEVSGRSTRRVTKRRRIRAEILESRQLLAGDVYFVDDVATNGNGAIGSPFNSIQAAANAADAGDIVEIRGGTYRETVNVPRSGTKINPITFRAYNGEDVVLSSANQVTGWTSANIDADGDGNNDPDVWRATVNWDVGPNSDQAVRDAFGKGSTDTGYNAGFDSDNDNSIGLSDFAAFRGTFGSELDP